MTVFYYILVLLITFVFSLIKALIFSISIFYFNLLMKDRNNDCDVAYKEGKIMLKRVVKTQALC